jgi:hypothetical protein
VFWEQSASSKSREQYDERRSVAIAGLACKRLSLSLSDILPGHGRCIIGATLVGDAARKKSAIQRGINLLSSRIVAARLFLCYVTGREIRRLRSSEGHCQSRTLQIARCPQYQETTTLFYSSSDLDVAGVPAKMELRLSKIGDPPVAEE